jgi:hypothetical protein
MELNLAYYIKKMQSTGVPVEMRMTRLEARHIFHEQNPEEYRTEAHIVVCGDDGMEYPSKLSNHWRQSFPTRHNFSYHMLATEMNKKMVTESSLEVIKNSHVSL